MRYSVGSGLDRLIGACTVACACSGAGSGRSARWRHSRVSSLTQKSFNLIKALVHDVTHLRKNTGMGVSGCPLFNGIGDLIKGTLYSAESLFKETLCLFASFLSHSGGIL